MNQINNTIPVAPQASEQASSQFLIGLITYKFISMVVGVLGNVGVIIYNIFMNKEKSPTTRLIVNLSFTDLLVCLTLQPIWIVELIQILTGAESNEEFFCKFIWSSGGVSVCLSISTLSAISFDKYVFIRWPLKYPMLMTRQRAHLMIGTTWVWAIAFLPLSMMYIDPSEVRGVCRTSNQFVLLSFIAYVYIPLTLIIFFNYKIFNIARKQRRKITRRYNQGLQAESFRTQTNVHNPSWQLIKKELKPVKTFAIVTGVLLCSFVPYSLCVFLDTFVCKCISVTLHITFSELIASNSIINPFIYGIRHNKYRKAYGQLLSYNILQLCRGFSNET